jgi:hypothetical protein
MDMPASACLIEATFVSFLFWGAHLITRGGSKRQAAWVMTVGLLLAATLTFADVAMSRMRSRMAAGLHYSAPLRELPPGWGKNFTPEQREQSIILARNAFKEHGRLIQYMKGDRSLATFEPTENDILDRDKLLILRSKADSLNAALSNDPLRWLWMVLTALWLGFAFGRLTNAKRLGLVPSEV